MPEPTNGGFASQEQFRNFVAKHQDGNWSSTFVSCSLPEHLADYKGDNIAQAFPKLFPYGFSGLPEDIAVQALMKQSGWSRHMSRNKFAVLRKYLQHRKPGFHEAKFNLIVENLIMKETIFASTRMYCNTMRSQQLSMGALYGQMTSQQLNSAIQQVRQNSSRQFSSNAENQFLRSIHACCQDLPHSNESASRWKTILFSYLIRFGLPALMITLTPDDSRSFRILSYSLPKDFAGSLLNKQVDVSKLSDEAILSDFRIMRDSRTRYPGLCAEEYSRIIDLVIKHVFCWNSETKCATDVGLFGKVQGWCLATEEQGRKTLHGHILVFLENWNDLLRAVKLQQEETNLNSISFQEAKQSARALVKNACSAKLFADFKSVTGAMATKPVFFHEGCRTNRQQKRIRYTVCPVSDQQLREMRHKRHCHKHNGHIASCPKCQKSFTIQEIIANALETHMGQQSLNWDFPDNSHRLERIVFEYQKDFEWFQKSEQDQAKRYFAANALCNFHLVSHTNRCFKKGAECYACLPEPPMESFAIDFAELPDIWANWKGIKENRYMFRFYPERNIEDCFMNTHNEMLTKILGCNTNVLAGLTGCSVFYATCYNVKNQQKEEQFAFQRVAESLVTKMRKLVSNKHKI